MGLDRRKLKKIDKSMKTIEDWQLEVERLKEALRKKEKENEDLIDQVRELHEGMSEMEKRMEEKLAIKIEELINSKLPSIDGAEGAGKRTSTPVGDSKVVLGSNNGIEKEKEKPETKKMKKKTSKNRRHERWMKLKGGRSVDSLYSSSNEGENKTLESETDEYDSKSDCDVKRSILITEVPKISRYNIYGGKSIGDHFKEYENYCRKKFGENKRFWVKELGETLEGRILDFYKTVVCGGEPRYEVMKQRMIHQVRRVKAGVRFHKVNDFDKVKLGKNEAIDMYAHRLETLARKKFGDEGINENKELMRKFLETVPTSLSEFINTRRKEKMRWAGERLLWEDILEIVEDRAFEVNGRAEVEPPDVFYGKSDDNNDSPLPYRSYRDALKANPLEVMVKFLEDFYGQEAEVRAAGQNIRSNDSVRNRITNQSTNLVMRNASNIQNEGIRCFRCGQLGHMRSECRLAAGACFSCGQIGHLANECGNSQSVGCRRCGSMDHWARDCLQGGGIASNVIKSICGNCGQDGHFSRMCREPKSTCSQCGKVGHVAGRCWSGRRIMNNHQGQNVARGQQVERQGGQIFGTSNGDISRTITDNGNRVSEGNSRTGN